MDIYFIGNVKKIKIEELDSAATDYLSELIMEHLNDKGITTESFSFAIEVDYIEENNDG